MKLRTLLFIFIPAIGIAGFVFFVRIAQYKPLNPPLEEYRALLDAQEITIPILPGDVVLGDVKAGITIVIFEDFACEACAQQMLILQSLVEKYPKKIKIVWKGLPVTRVPISSELAHHYGYCAHKQKKFESFAETAFANQASLTPDVVAEIARISGLDESKLTACLASGEPQQYAQNTEVIARALNIQSVPALFVDNTQIQTPTRLAQWETILEL